MRTPSFHSAWIAADGLVGSEGSVSSLFPWWSFTKTVLALCTLRLVDDGRLQLDALRPGKPYTLRQLLQHHAGVPNYGSLKAYHDAVAHSDPPWSREHLLAAVGRDRLDFVPGTGWAYSNVGYLFVREIIEEATGLPLATALRELVIAPLELSSVRLAVTPSDMSDVFWPALRLYHPGWVYHGCLIGATVDAAKLLHALFSGSILNSESLDEMLERHELGGAIPGRPWTVCAYGLGVMSGRMGEAGTAIGHSDAARIASTLSIIFPTLLLR
ncbi:serine hydrolase [Acidisoma sp. L85]|uniref:serine hydrolase domain-containing protein n=1 Tax=Acidisoma sp. L85 TaxID=1641850 RepID=UPI001C204311|nr:serine hydrolase domain-containing protein [Acidisoma sp. L85]